MGLRATGPEGAPAGLSRQVKCGESTPKGGLKGMRYTGRICLALVAAVTCVALIAGPAAAQQKPDILFIMGDDIGWMQVGAYQRPPVKK